ncbi:MAG: peptide ligase PGM1-related protein [Actinomycetota bacterium]
MLEGSEDLYSLDEMQEAIDMLRVTRPDAQALVIKLNHGFSGQGNAILEMTDVASPLASSRTVFCGEGESWPSFERKILLQGGIVEELVRHAHSISPSAQVRVTPTGQVEVVSTHDQILGGPDAQVYLGCRFPADNAYRAAIARFGYRMAEVLAEAGVIGSFGMDFIGVPVDGGYTLYLGEINLRMGGTTHPLQMARAVTGGVYEPESGDLLVGGRPRCYVGSDNLKSDRYRRFSPGDVIDLIDKNGLAFDKARGTGVTLHLLGAISGFGKLGALCIGESAQEADALLDEVVACLGSS